jgi:putative addiction module killer protein
MAPRNRGISDRLGTGYRINLARDGEALIVLLGGGTKKGQQADIERAEALWSTYKERKAGLKRTRKR